MVDLVQMVLTLSILGVYSHYYKDNPLYSIVESLTVGIYAGINVVESVRTIYFNELTAVAGKPELIIPILLGIGVFTFFTQRLIGVYRTVLVLIAANRVGLAISAELWSTMDRIYRMSMPQYGVISLAYLICGTLSVTVWLYNRRFDQPLRQVRRVGLFVILSAFGYNVGQQFVPRITSAIGAINTAITTDGIYVLAVVVVAIAVDAIYGWRRLLGPEKPQEVTLGSTP